MTNQVPLTFDANELGHEWGDILNQYVMMKLKFAKEIERLQIENDMLANDNRQLREQLQQSQAALHKARARAGLSTEAAEIAARARATIDGQQSPEMEKPPEGG